MDHVLSIILRYKAAEMNLTEYLKQIVNDDQWDYEKDCDLSARGITPDIVDEKLLLKVASKLHKQKERESFWEDLLDYLPEKSLTQNVFGYLLENKIALVSLAHRRFDDERLKKLIPYAEEALFTLAKRYYGQSEYYPSDFDGEIRYSAEDFAGFLCEYYYDALLEQLSSLKPDDPEKEMILFYFYSKKHRPDVEKLIESKCPEATNDPATIQSAYESNAPLRFLALSRNLFVTTDMLESLGNVSDMENASCIRSNARKTLSIKKYLDSHEGAPQITTNKAYQDPKKAAECMTAPMRAVWQDNPGFHLLNESLAAGVDVNEKNVYGMTALMYAAWRDVPSIEVVGALLDAGADVNAKDEGGMTALMYSVWGDTPSVEIVGTLLDAGADVNARDEDGMTALMYSVWGEASNVEVIRILLDAGADVNAKDEDGMTALMYSVWGDTPNVEVIDTLLDAGAEVGMKDHEGKRAIDHAQANERLKGTDTLKRLENMSR